MTSSMVWAWVVAVTSKATNSSNLLPALELILIAKPLIIYLFFL